MTTPSQQIDGDNDLDMPGTCGMCGATMPGPVADQVAAHTAAVVAARQTNLAVPVNSVSDGGGTTVSNNLRARLKKLTPAQRKAVARAVLARRNAQAGYGR